MGLVTEAGLASAYVLFELGARWGAAKELIPLLAPGISPDLLQGPISNINALSCSSDADLHELVRQIGASLKLEAEPSAVYLDKLKLVTTYPQAVGITLPQAYVPTVPQSAVDQLAEFRAEAVHKILNRPISTTDDLEALSSYTKQWWQRVDAVLEEHFSIAEQLNFTRLGAVPNVMFPHSFNSEHAKILREYALQERRLLDIIARHTR